MAHIACLRNTEDCQSGLFLAVQNEIERQWLDQQNRLRLQHFLIRLYRKKAQLVRRQLILFLDIRKFFI